MSKVLVISVSMLLLAGCKKEAAVGPASETSQQMVQVTGGTFQMGGGGDSTLGYIWDMPLHSVTVSSFFIDNTEVTYGKWTDVRTWGLSHGYTDLAEGVSPAFKPDYPVTMPNWYDIVKWCNARSEKDGLTSVYYTRFAQDTVYRTGWLGVLNSAVKWAANGYRLPTAAEWEFAAKGGTTSKGYTFSGSNNLEMWRGFLETRVPHLIQSGRKQRMSLVSTI